MENFDEKALTWDDNPRRIAMARAVADEIIQAIPDLTQKSGFEYGCGTGNLSFYLQSHLKDITLGDNSEGMLEVLKKKIASHNIENMRLLKVDLAVDQAPEFQIDLIYTQMAMHHIEMMDEVIGKFYRMLNLHGYLCIADLVTEDGSFHGADFSGHCGFDRAELASKLELAGFKNVRSKICFEITKESANGQMQTYPIFFMIGQK